MNWFRMPALIAAFSLGFIVLSGCALSQYPVTDGFHHSLPVTNTRIVIWGTSPVVTATATTWLQKRGLKVVERARLLQILEEQRIRLTHTADDERPILSVGKLLGAGMVVFADASVSSAIETDHLHGGYATLHTAFVSIRGVEIETSEVLWNGVARYPHKSDGAADDTLAKLTCHALATAWGFRPAGDQAISTQAACAAEKPIVSATPY